MHPDWAILDRRLLLKLGTAGLAALSFAGGARVIASQGFTHGVASGEPSATSVLLWTRYVGASDKRLTAEVSLDSDFAHIVTGASVTALSGYDHTAKVTVSGLHPGRHYYYRFIALDGTMSAIGRTRTLPSRAMTEDLTSRFTLALVSCANMPFGWFNAYGHAAQRNDIDLVVHTGDYFYEYGMGIYPVLSQAVPGRAVQPSHEATVLADYRLRYACYRSDRDLARLHQLFPMIAQWDDHEFANNAWSGGAENHQSESEGDWKVRRIAAERAYREWMPVADTRTARTAGVSGAAGANSGGARYYQIGDLATLFLPETRITARSKPIDLGAIVKGASDPSTALKRFREDDYLDPAREMLGRRQEDWLAAGMVESVRSGTRWQICAQQTLMGSLISPEESANWVSGETPQSVRQAILLGRLAAKHGLPFNLDSWDGYPAARGRFLAATQAADADLVVLSGDSHNSWAFDLAHEGHAAGVEIGGPSVSSPGLEYFTPGIDERDRVTALRGSSPQLRWANTEKRGYATIVIERDKLTGNWHFMEDVRRSSLALAGSKSMTVHRAQRAFAEQ